MAYGYRSYGISSYGLRAPRTFSIDLTESAALSSLFVRNLNLSTSIALNESVSKTIGTSLTESTSYNPVFERGSSLFVRSATDDFEVGDSISSVNVSKNVLEDFLVDTNNFYTLSKPLGIDLVSEDADLVRGENIFLVFVRNFSKGLELSDEEYLLEVFRGYDLDDSATDLFERYGFEDIFREVDYSLDPGDYPREVDFKTRLDL